jgi:hypothetical protein
MPYFDRFDICEAYLAIEWDYNKSGWLHERRSNQRWRESTEVQLSRMQFRPAANFRGYPSLSENGKEIYAGLCLRYGFPAPTDKDDQ